MQKNTACIIMFHNILKENNYPFYNEVYYHGEITDEYNSLYLDILNSADMQIDKYGNLLFSDNIRQTHRSRVII